MYLFTVGGEILLIIMGMLSYLPSSCLLLLFHVLLAVLFHDNVCILCALLFTTHIMCAFQVLQLLFYALLLTFHVLCCLPSFFSFN